MNEKVVIKKIGACLLFITYVNSLEATTLVYGLRIRRAFALGAAAAQNGKTLKIVTSFVPIFYKRTRHIMDDRVVPIDLREETHVNGALINIRLLEKSWFLEFTTGVEKETVCFNGTSVFKNSRTGLDDIVISGGYNFFPENKFQFVAFGLAGFPTRRKVSPLEDHGTLIGTRFFSLGFGTEFSYSLVSTLKESFTAILQNRFLHFFTRRFFPILPCDALIQPGNTIDILLALQYRHKRTVVEGGYNPTFFTNQAILLATGKVAGENFVRHGVYASFIHLFKKFPVIPTPVSLGAGISLSHADKLDSDTTTIWINFTTIF